MRAQASPDASWGQERGPLVLAVERTVGSKDRKQVSASAAATQQNICVCARKARKNDEGFRFQSWLQAFVRPFFLPPPARFVYTVGACCLVRVLLRRGSSAAQRAAASEACKSISLERLQAQYHRPLSEGQSEAANKIVINFFLLCFPHCRRGSPAVNCGLYMMGSAFASR